MVYVPAEGRQCNVAHVHVMPLPSPGYQPFSPHLAEQLILKKCLSCKGCKIYRNRNMEGNRIENGPETDRKDSYISLHADKPPNFSEMQTYATFLAIWRLSGSVLLQCFFVPVGMFFIMKTLEGEWYMVIKAYKFTVFERIFLYYHSICMSALSLHIESTDSITSDCWSTVTSSSMIDTSVNYGYWQHVCWTVDWRYYS